jgi:hypothetical protein
MTEEQFCDAPNWDLFEVNGGLVLEGLILVYLFCVMMVLTDEYLMGIAKQSIFTWLYTDTAFPSKEERVWYALFRLLLEAFVRSSQ